MPRRIFMRGDCNMDNINKKVKEGYVRPRNVNLAFRVTEKEREMIERKMEQAGIQNMRAYIVKMAVDGSIINVELGSVNEMIRLLSNATNNINQIAKKANQTGNINIDDIQIIKEYYYELWAQAKEILLKLSKIVAG